MKADISLSCAPLPRGGASLGVQAPGVNMSIPMDRRATLGVVVSLLRAAGIERAAFDDGQLAVLAER